MEIQTQNVESDERERVENREDIVDLFIAVAVLPCAGVSVVHLLQCGGGK